MRSVVRQGEEKIQADVSDNQGTECDAQCIALLPRHIHGRCAVGHVSESWLVLEQRRVYHFHCDAVLGRHVWYRSSKEAGVEGLYRLETWVRHIIIFSNNLYEIPSRTF